MRFGVWCCCKTPEGTVSPAKLEEIIVGVLVRQPLEVLRQFLTPTNPERKISVCPLEMLCINVLYSLAYIGNLRESI